MSQSKKPAAVLPTREWLNGAERDELRRLEDVIERGVRAGIETGKALGRIRAARLHRQSNSSFEAYCKDRFDLGARRINQFIDAANIVEQVRTNVPGPVPANEAVARELGRQRDDPAGMQETWAKAVEKHGDKPTAKQVRAIRGPILAAAPEPAYDPNDTRFTTIEVAADALKQLPAPEAIVFPVDQGDIDTISKSLDYIVSVAPKIKAAFKRHQAAQRQSARAVA